MKTSEEMARSVMTRAKAKRSAQKRNLITTAAALICVCGIGVGAWMAGRTPENPDNTLQVQPTVSQPKNNVQLRPVRISLLSTLSSNNHTISYGNGVRVPAQQQIRVVDTRRLTEEQAQAVRESENRFANYMLDNAYGEGAAYLVAGKNAVVTVVAAGTLYLPIEDPDLVESVRVSVTGDGRLYSMEALKDPQTDEIIPGEYILEGWDLKNEWRRIKGVDMIWMLTEQMHQDLANDPTIPLSSITSTITTAVNMKDGTTVSVVVDVTVDDNGFVYFTFQGDAKNSIQIPCLQQIRVADLRGLTDDEARAVREGESEYVHDIIRGDGQSLMSYGENAVVTVFSAGCLNVPFEDPDLVESIRVSVTGDGQINGIEPLKDEQTGEKIPGLYMLDRWDLTTQWRDNRGVEMTWMLSEQMHQSLVNDPTIPLSSITSTITTTVYMKDGTLVISVVDVTVDDDGFVYFTSREETTV